MNSQTKEKIPYVIAGLLVGIIVGVASTIAFVKFMYAKPIVISEAKPALTISTTKPISNSLTGSFAASGSVGAWQDSIVGAEVNGLRIKDVRVNVGDYVKQGQVLATFATETVTAELAQSKANVAEAEAALAEAQLNADRAKTLDASGALSAQQINQYFTLAKTAEARLASARAFATVAQVKLSQTQVLAPDSGTISARAATVGSVVQSGQELFRMVRKNRLEWRAEVTAAELNNVSVGQKVSLTTPAGEVVAGTVRMVAPTVDPLTRNVQVFVDLVPSRAAKAGMFARGEFQLGAATGLTVPQQALVIRDGFAFVFLVKSDNRVVQVKVEAGRRFSDRVEIRKGLTADNLIAAQGAGFLNDGDLVKIAPQTATKSPTPSAPKK